ncbi:hypothetical protein TWF281_003864 [Arthrobotrys megalospora]
MRLWDTLIICGLFGVAVISNGGEKYPIFCSGLPESVDGKQGGLETRSTEYESSSNVILNRNSSVVLDIPVSYNSSIGWYANFTIGSRSSSFSKKFRLLLSTRDTVTVVKSSEQTTREKINPQTNRIDAVFDLQREELYNAKISTGRFRSFPSYNSNQRCFETQSADDFSLRYSEICVSTDITYETTPFVDRYPVCLLSWQPDRDTEYSFDGRLALSPQPIFIMRSLWNAATQNNTSQVTAPFDTEAKYKPLPAGFEQKSKYWGDYGTFATYFTSTESERPTLQFNVDNIDGDTTKYTGALRWFESVSKKPYSIYWNIAAKAIQIGWRGTFNEYPLAHKDLLKNPLVAETVIPHRNSLLEFNTTYPALAAIMSSGSMWTRLHPWIVDRVYAQIPGVVTYKTTYYLPCDMPEYAIPQISFGLGNNRVSDTEEPIWYTVKKSGFIIDTYRHPEIVNLCAGAIQNSYRAPNLRLYPDAASEKVPSATMELGQWIFKSWYMVFKVTKDTKVKGGRRYVGIAKMT